MINTIITVTIKTTNHHHHNNMIIIANNKDNKDLANQMNRAPCRIKELMIIANLLSFSMNKVIEVKNRRNVMEQKDELKYLGIFLNHWLT